MFLLLGLLDGGVRRVVGGHRLVFGFALHGLDRYGLGFLEGFLGGFFRAFDLFRRLFCRLTILCRIFCGLNGRSRYGSFFRALGGAFLSGVFFSCVFFNDGLNRSAHHGSGVDTVGGCRIEAVTGGHGNRGAFRLIDGLFLGLGRFRRGRRYSLRFGTGGAAHIVTVGGRGEGAHRGAIHRILVGSDGGHSGVLNRFGARFSIPSGCICDCGG